MISNYRRSGKDFLVRNHWLKMIFRFPKGQFVLASLRLGIVLVRKKISFENALKRLFTGPKYLVRH